MNFSSLLEIIRKSTYSRTIGLFVMAIITNSCISYKKLGENEMILNNYALKGVKPSLRDEMIPLQVQKPNRRFLVGAGPSHLVWVYNTGKKNFLFKYDSARILKNKKEIDEKFINKIEKTDNENRKRRLTDKRLKKLSKKDRALAEGNQLMRWGEPLAVYDSLATDETVLQMKQYLNSKGFYDNHINYNLDTAGIKNKKLNITYNIDRGTRYLIDSIIYVIPDPKIRDIFTGFEDEIVIKKGNQITQSDLSKERDRVYNLMVNRGFYEFSKDYVRFEIDSVSLRKARLIIKEVISNPPNRYRHKEYVIDSVIFVTDAGASTSKKIPNEDYKGITYTYGRFKYTPKILDWHTQLEHDRIYQRDKVLETQRQLAILDNFKFININFDTLDGEFIAHIFTSPADRFQSTTEAGFSVQSQGYPGPFAQLNLKNRNLFRGLEITELNSQFKLQGVNGVTQTTATYSSIQYGSELSITFPQFLSPLGKFYKKKISRFNPRTRFGLAFKHEDRLDEYQRTNFNTNMSYVWKTRENISYTFKPADIGFIDSNTRDGFIEELEAISPSYANTFRSSFVSSGSFQITLNDNYGQGSSSYAQFFIETGGHLFSLAGNQPFGTGLEYYKYSKFSADLRKTMYLTRMQSLATRFNLGIAIPYGNNGFDKRGNVISALPYEKYFFGGGSNSIRAWRPRRLGPGAFAEINTDSDGNTSVDYQREQPGDLLLEMSVEFRQKLTGFIDWSVFIDAGNIWRIRSRTVNKELDPQQDNGIFYFDKFAREIAIGAGYGLRFDLSFLIFRVDIGYKIVDPAQPLGNRWVAGDNEIVTFGKKFPFVYLNPFDKRFATFNIGIGYPF